MYEHMIAARHFGFALHDDGHGPLDFIRVPKNEGVEWPIARTGKRLDFPYLSDHRHASLIILLAVVAKVLDGEYFAARRPGMKPRQQKANQKSNGRAGSVRSESGKCRYQLLAPSWPASEPMKGRRSSSRSFSGMDGATGAGAGSASCLRGSAVRR
jgi:hypothetical protein